MYIQSVPRQYPHKLVAQLTELVLAGLAGGGFVPLVRGHLPAPELVQLSQGVLLVDRHRGQQANVYHRTWVGSKVMSGIGMRYPIVLSALLCAIVVTIWFQWGQI